MKEVHFQRQAEFINSQGAVSVDVSGLLREQQQREIGNFARTGVVNDVFDGIYFKYVNIPEGFTYLKRIDTRGVVTVLTQRGSDGHIERTEYKLKGSKLGEEHLSIEMPRQDRPYIASLGVLNYNGLSTTEAEELAREFASKDKSAIHLDKDLRTIKRVPSFEYLPETPIYSYAKAEPLPIPVRQEDSQEARIAEEARLANEAEEARIEAEQREEALRKREEEIKEQERIRNENEKKAWDEAYAKLVKESPLKPGKAEVSGDAPWVTKFEENPSRIVSVATHGLPKGFTEGPPVLASASEKREILPLSENVRLIGKALPGFVRESVRNMGARVSDSRALFLFDVVKKEAVRGGKVIGKKTRGILGRAGQGLRVRIESKTQPKSKPAVPQNDALQNQTADTVTLFDSAKRVRVSRVDASVGLNTGKTAKNGTENGKVKAVRLRDSKGRFASSGKEDLATAISAHKPAEKSIRGNGNGHRETENGTNGGIRRVIIRDKRTVTVPVEFEHVLTPGVIERVIGNNGSLLDPQAEEALRGAVINTTGNIEDEDILGKIKVASPTHGHE